MKNVVIAGYVRSPFHLARKGDPAKVRPDEMAGQVVKVLNYIYRTTPPDIGRIQDVVEQSLIAANHLECHFASE